MTADAIVSCVTRTSTTKIQTYLGFFLSLLKFLLPHTFIFNPKSYFGEFQNSFFLDELCFCVKLHTSENLDFAILSRPQ